jgi:hypothetical protein
LPDDSGHSEIQYGNKAKDFYESFINHGGQYVFFLENQDEIRLIQSEN